MRAILVALFFATPATAQDLPSMEDVSSAASDLAGRVADHVMVADMIGRDVVGPDGAALGTLENLVVLPGGNLVAAVVALEDGTRVALPWDAAKAGVKAGEPVEVPFTRAEIDGQAALRDLSDALGL